MNPYAAPVSRPVLPPARASLHGSQIASLRARVASRAIDSLVFSGPWAIPLVARALDFEDTWIVLGSFVALFAWISLGLAQAMLIATTSASIGKRLYGIKMVGPDGRDVGFVDGWLVRSFIFGAFEAVCSAAFLGIPSVVDVLFGLGKYRRTLHDRVAGTYVVEAR